AGGYERIPFDPQEISDQKWSKEFLNHRRADILHEWNNGRDKRMSVATVPNKTDRAYSLDLRLWRNRVRYQAPLLQPRTGVADIEQQISKLKYLEGAGSNVSSVQLDAASRSRLYEHAKQGVEMSVARKRSLLNGFPVPVYGVGETNRMIRALNTPFQLRAGGPDHRFTYEIALLAGATGLEGGFICYLLPYDKLTSPAESLLNWQYVDRLCSLYEEEHGICINREYFGTLTASLIEPSLAIVVNIIQAVLSAKQGVRSISVGYAEQGNRVQDVAAMQVLPEMTNQYLDQFGCKDCRVTTVFHQFMAAFPSDYAKAEELIVNSSITATLAGATRMMVKTPVEAIKIPDRYDNEKALALCRQGIAGASGRATDHKRLVQEKALLKREVTQLMDHIIELGNGSVALGAIRAIEEGFIDVPWSPNIYNKNQVVTVRDTHGAVRFLDFGSLPFTEDIKSFHGEKIHFRKMMERDSSTFSLLEKDLTRIWKNDYKQWPLDDTYVN
ncbi:MAG: methylaspartate mutase subunit E, partial [Cytophagales bacterium]|nr:methylaspartate mutase subunit E [Cytophagales bacterium]